MAEYKFERFVNKDGKSEGRITITKSFSFGFPTKFYQDNNIVSYRYAELFFDKEEMVVGIHFTNEERTRDKFTVVKNPGGFGGSIVAKSFFTYYGINPEEYRGKYDWTKYQDSVGELFVIKLQKLPASHSNNGGDDEVKEESAVSTQEF